MRVTLGGGMAVQGPVPERWKKVTGTPLLQAYGLTETSPAATINPLDMGDFNGSIGLPISSTEVSIRDDYGNEVPQGQIGARPSASRTATCSATSPSAIST